MSKLNDSTLKIFKKYRLDTDMSVFGNENKLYDVVKVMDDMVGGQVGSKKTITWFRDSLNTENYRSYNYTAAPTEIRQYTQTYAQSIEINNVSHVYCYDPFTMKYLCDNMTQDVWLYGLLVNSDEKIVAYVGFVMDSTTETRLSGKNYGLYKDVNCSIPCSLGDFDFSKAHYIRTVYCISDNKISSLANLGYYWTIFFTGGTTGDKYIDTPKELKAKISLPETGFAQNYITRDSYNPFNCNILVEV